MKILKWLAVISGVVGVVIVLLGMISWILDKSILPVDYVVNYFLVSNSFFLIALTLLGYIICCQLKKE
jgi:hypothetical protein